MPSFFNKGETTNGHKSAEDLFKENKEPESVTEEGNSEIAAKKDSVSFASVAPPKDTSKAPVDSMALYKELKQKTELAKILMEKARAELKKENYGKSYSLADSAQYLPIKNMSWLPLEFWFWSPDRIRDKTGNSIILQDAWETYLAALAIAVESDLSMQEILMDSAGWFRYGKGTLERQFEFDILRWYFGGVVIDSYIEYTEGQRSFYADAMYPEGPSFFYGYAGHYRGHYPPYRRIIKSVRFSNGILTVNLRADPDDIGDPTKEFKQHPLKFMKKFHDFIYTVWGTRNIWKKRITQKKMRNRYKKVEEIVITLYYPGKQKGTEIPIAKFGLTRSVGESVNLGDTSIKDGTFQDLLKEKGTYWLHPQIPDMGTPISLIKR